MVAVIDVIVQSSPIVVDVIVGGGGTTGGGSGSLPDPVTIAHGGTGATTAATARTNLGLGTAATHADTDFQPIDADLTAIAALTTLAFGRSLLTLIDAAAGRTSLGLGTMATQNADAIAVTGGQATGLTQVGLTGAAAPSYTQGKLVYDTDNECLTFFNNEPDVGMQVGEEVWVRVRNATGSTITNGQAVYVNGNHAGTGLPTVALAKADAAATARCEGVATHDIENNTIGYITTIGMVRNLNTGAYTNGDPLYLSAATAGALTSTMPALPNYQVRVGTVTKAAGGTSGSIYARPRNPVGPVAESDVTNLTTDLAALQTSTAANAAKILVQQAAFNNYSVMSGGLLSPNSTPTKLDLAAGVDSMGTTTLTYAAQTAIATTISSMADATNPKWVAVELDSAGVVQFNQGTAAAAPAFPTLTASRVVHGFLYIPANATNVDTLLSTSNGLAKLIDTRVVYPFPLEGRTTVADASYTAVATDRVVAYSTLTANRTVTLPSAASVPVGWIITVADRSGSAAGGSSPLTITVRASGSETINGVAFATNFETIREPYGTITLRSDGVSDWLIINVSPTTRVEVFTASGTWRVPMTLKRADMLVIAGGGAGGSGEKRATSTNCGGGAGGDSGAIAQASFDATGFSATETVTVGAGGTAGGATTVTGNGASGGNGVDSSVTVAGTIRARAQAGLGGAGGNGGAGGAANPGGEGGTILGTAGGTGASGSGSANAAVGANGNLIGGGGGGGGGGVTSANGLLTSAAGGSGAGGLSAGGGNYALAGGPGGAAGSVGTPGASGSTVHGWGGGGGGGGGGGRNTNNTTGGNGGAGGSYGGGGGGGGNGVGTGNGGNGGAGGAGLVVITSYR